ncbi:MAG: hypothetical protein WCG93_10780 [Paludibacter sp.]
MKTEEKIQKKAKTTETNKRKDSFWQISEKHQGLVKIVDMRAVMK